MPRMNATHPTSFKKYIIQFFNNIFGSAKPRPSVMSCTRQGRHTRQVDLHGICVVILCPTSSSLSFEYCYQWCRCFCTAQFQRAKNGTLATIGKATPSITPSVSPHQYHPISITPSVSPHQYHPISITPSVSPHQYHPISITPSVSPHQYHPISITPSVSPHQYHPISITPSVSPHQYHPISITPSVSPHQYHPISITPSVSPHQYHPISIITPSVSPRQYHPISITPSGNTALSQLFQGRQLYHCFVWSRNKALPDLFFSIERVSV